MNFDTFSIQKVYMSMFVYKMYTKFQMNFLAWWVYKKYITFCIQNILYKIFKWVYGYASIQKINIHQLACCLQNVYKISNNFLLPYIIPTKTTNRNTGKNSLNNHNFITLS